ncbi:PQQ-binding-like beta-propeller repeat protein [Planctomicrobium sp. SH661]|uniref:outer membrane protein assembly factor BamB family protein n=1 Tax=Planctomicrobium sp. SH661 TaxID=3448124 RepID=UPI003F5C3FEF
MSEVTGCFPFPRQTRSTGWAVLLIATLTASLEAGDWPQWLGPTRNGVTDETLEPWTGEPQVVWKHEIGDGFSVPVVADGVLYAHAAVKGEDAEEVVALNIETGEVLWRDKYPRSRYESQLGNGPRATPTVSAGRLYTIGITGVLSCYDCSTGKRLWQTNPYVDLKANQPGFGVCSSPLIVGERIILPVGGDGSGVVAYDTQTGQIAWKGFDEPAAAASPVLLSRKVGDRQIGEVVVQTTLRLAGIDPVDGTLRWEHPLIFEPSGVSPTPLVQGNLLICSTQDNGTLALELPGDEGGQPVLKWWNQEMASYFSTGTIGKDDRVFVVTNSVSPLPKADIRCLNVQTGEEHWKRGGLGYFHVGVISLQDGKLLILDDAGNLKLAETGGGKYKELCKSQVCGGTFVVPVLSNGRVFVRDRTHITCVDPRNGQAVPESSESAK